MPIPESLTCTACGGTEFGEVPAVTFEMWVSKSGQPGIKNRNPGRDPSGDLAVCLNCGKAELFISDPRSFVQTANPKLRAESKSR
jgi:predicted nucleic-acid-binding Zn-ribbon protein